MRRLRDVVLKNSRDVFLQGCQSKLQIFLGIHKDTKWKTHLWKVTLRITNQQTRLSTASISHHDELFRIGGRLSEIGGLGHPST